MVAVVDFEFEEKRGGRKVWKRGIWVGKRKEVEVGGERSLEMGCFSRGNFAIKMLNGVKGI